MSNFSSFLPFFTAISNNNFPEPNFFLEQYTTSLDILKVYFDLIPITQNQSILDLGIGTGLLSFMALKKGISEAIGIDIDLKALKVARKISKASNIKNLNLIHSSVEFLNLSKFKGHISGVIMNPPFGTKRKFLDFVFLKRAMQTNGWILTLHKKNSISDRKLHNLCQEHNYKIQSITTLVYSLPKTYEVHNLKFYKVEVNLYYLIPNLEF